MKRTVRYSVAAIAAATITVTLACASATGSQATPVQPVITGRSPVLTWPVKTREHVDLWLHGFALLSNDSSAVPLFRRGYRDDLTVLAIYDSLASRIWRRGHTEAKVEGKSGFLFGVTIPAEGDLLELMRPALGAAGRAAGFSDDEIADLELAASEAVENIILHAYGVGHPGDITLAVHQLDDGLMLRIRDFAPKVDQAMIKPRPLDEVRPGGLGTHFIRAVMDDATFIPLPDGEGNLLELVKRRKKG